MAVILLVLAPMVAVVLLLKVMMLVMLRNLHLDFPSRRMRSTPLGVVLIFVTCFFRAERARERGLSLRSRREQYLLATANANGDLADAGHDRFDQILSMFHSHLSEERVNY